MLSTRMRKRIYKTQRMMPEKLFISWYKIAKNTNDTQWLEDYRVRYYIKRFKPQQC